MFNIRQRQINKLLKRVKAYQAGRLNAEPSESALKKEIKIYKKLIKLYQKLIGKKRYPHAQIQIIESYRVAAGLHDAESSYHLGKYMMDEANYRQHLEEEGLFSHPSNLKQRDSCYEQAHIYLEAATNLGHIEAMRLLGLSYIHGWGKAKDKDKGFDMVVSSIEKENAWGKLTEIFSRLGLNRPELISELIQHRRK
ncbi:hypothetical protein [Legionella sp. W05-934-2]|jgi:TPR repeat protein|uniref:hypothetical protein n=1 Tax=Legionella sp. W05-934-2 TaxID=1198649 RepID=UPI0034635540